ncbi:MAG: glycosyltransferase [Desulfovibrio sp.]|nr:glycosyltransferase [Desulfovibrio sp.]
MNILLDGHDISLVGGIERFTTGLADAMTQRGHKVYLFTYSPEGTRHKFALNPEVELVHYLFTGDPAHIPGLRRQILDCGPDVFIAPASSSNPLLWCAALKNTGIPLVYSEHSDPLIIENERWNGEERAAALCAADRIHLLFESYSATVPAAARKNTRVIPNPLLIASKQPMPEKEKTKDRQHALLSLGRLDEKAKRISLLIRAFALLASEFPVWRLDIWGEGPDRKALQREIDRHSLSGRAFLRGLATEPWKQYATADVFCIPSRHEGFGLTVVEAMSCGLPVVGFAGCRGVNELIQDGENGLLASEMTPESLADALRPLMADAFLRREMGIAALKSVEKFAPGRVFDAWEALLAETVARKEKTRLQECMAGNADEPELARHYEKMREVLRRKNVLLEDGQWLRRIVRRRPLLRNMCRIIRGLLQPMMFILQ